MKSLCRAVMFAVFVGAVFVPHSADAAPILQVNGSGILTGATGVDVNGTLYDVQFADGTCVAIFSGCDAASDFDFTTQASAFFASQALLDQVFLGNFDTNGALTAGCTTSISQLCRALTPFVVGSGLVTYVIAANLPGAGFDSTSQAFFSISNDITSNEATVWADWSLSATATPVPEPASLLLLGSGIAGIAAKVRKRRKQQVQ